MLFITILLYLAVFVAVFTIWYFLMKNAVKNGTIEALERLDLVQSTSHTISAHIEQEKKEQEVQAAVDAVDIDEDSQPLVVLPGGQIIHPGEE